MRLASPAVTVLPCLATLFALCACTNGNVEDPLAGLSCAVGDGLRWTGTAWACAPGAALPSPCAANTPLTWSGSAWVCAGPLAVAGTSDLLGNGATDGRITAFETGDPQPQTNASYDAAHAARLPFYSTITTGNADISSLCRTGDLLVSGGCVSSSDQCYLPRTYPIFNAATAQSGWHCRGADRATGAPCNDLTAIAVCLKSF